MTSVIVHEWLSKAGGSENVFRAMADMYPEADLIAAWNDDVERFPLDRTHETWLARTPLRRSKAAALPLMPLTWRHLPYGPYDWALISSHAFSHHARFKGARDIERFVYVHSPARYVWTPEVDPRGSGLAARMASRILQPVDRRRAQEGARFAANSDYVKTRIEHSWGVPAEVIYPPVAVTEIQSVTDWDSELSCEEYALIDSLPSEFVLGASRFIPYKRLDRVIAVAESVGLPVVLAGAGPEEQMLRERVSESTIPGRLIL